MNARAAVRKSLAKRQALFGWIVWMGLGGALWASTIPCLPLVLPDGHSLPGLCSAPEPPWPYLPGDPLSLLGLLPPLPAELILPPLPELPPLPGLDLPPLPSLDPELIWPDPPMDPDPAPAHAPEPAGYVLIGLGLLALGILGRWRRARVRSS